MSTEDRCVLLTEPFSRNGLVFFQRLPDCCKRRVKTGRFHLDSINADKTLRNAEPLSAEQRRWSDGDSWGNGDSASGEHDTSALLSRLRDVTVEAGLKQLHQRLNRGFR